ncbi:hypothetical protein D9613_001221 [Agrocybe pediades]|uniref:CFEM domain-containing protein n=1 Tax=Agrocybe pediades TaxID=84607 RepID=A0A8H4R160_9AGAR|nr:hypothetical protein D9613_001221 [Agrocybe pediades]
MFSKVFAVLATFAVVANAQAGFDTLSPCALACVIPGATQNGCEDPTDAQCVCASAQIVADVTQCLTANCEASDIQAVLAVQQAQCSAAGVTPTGDATGVNTIPFTLASSAASSASSPAPTGSGSSSAGGPLSSASSIASSVASSVRSSTSATAPATSGTPAPTGSGNNNSGAVGLSAKNAGMGALVAAVVAGVFTL